MLSMTVNVVRVLRQCLAWQGMRDVNSERTGPSRRLGRRSPVRTIPLRLFPSELLRYPFTNPLDRLSWTRLVPHEITLQTRHREHALRNASSEACGEGTAFGRREVRAADTVRPARVHLLWLLTSFNRSR